MKKNIIPLVLISSMVFFAQVGINTYDPKYFIEANSKNDSFINNRDCEQQLNLQTFYIDRNISADT
ncbi:hypothetical protein [Chryseobacterium gambrini]|uniref:hypothetical protein n=1 Tax=Chryseobacterium gambrini TaxID=373672 RepID=UPI0025B4DB37|nr:hypothetical protein [Chryseobacterium gambrini]MDN4029864.1 hypothetical protein [Chryseobacterium gambrini]